MHQPRELIEYLNTYEHKGSNVYCVPMKTSDLVNIGKMSTQEKYILYSRKDSQEFFLICETPILREEIRLCKESAWKTFVKNTSEFITGKEEDSNLDTVRANVFMYSLSSLEYTCFRVLACSGKNKPVEESFEDFEALNVNYDDFDLVDLLEEFLRWKDTHKECRKKEVIAMIENIIEKNDL